MPVHTTEQARALAQKRHSLDTYIKSIVARAPELTPEQRDRLASLLRPTGRTPDDLGGTAA